MNNDSITGSSPEATLLDDVSGLIPKHIRFRAELYAAEAENISHPIQKYLTSRPSKRRAPFTLPWVFRVHKEMFGDVWKWAGKRRTTDGLNIGIPAYQIETALHQLLDDLAAWRQYQSYDAIERAARFHHRSVQIHPFLNGNGRWSRLLANILLKQDGLSPTRWPEETIGTASTIRDAYISAVRAADAGDFAALIELHRRYTPQPAG